MHASLRRMISATALSLLVHLSLVLQQSYGPTDRARCSATFFIISSRGHFEYQLIPRNRLPHWYSFAVPHHPNLTDIWDSPRHRHTFSVPPRPMTPMIVDTSSTKVPPPLSTPLLNRQTRARSPTPPPLPPPPQSRQRFFPT